MGSPGSSRLAEWWTKPLFVIDGLQFCGIDVTLGAMASDGWPAFERDLAECLACASDASRRGRIPASAAIDDAATAFRYEHDLISAEELEAWLAQSDLSVDDWTRYLEWQVLRNSSEVPIDEVLDAASPSTAELIHAAFIFGMCSGQFRRFQETLVSRAVLVRDPHACLNLDTLAAFDGAAARLVHTYSHWLGLRPQEAHQAAARALALESAADDEAKRLLTGPALMTAIERNRLQWQLLETDRVVFSSEAEAREALLCIADEGLTLRQVAEISKRSVDRRVQFLEEIDQADADHLMALAPGAVAGPIVQDEGVVLLALSARSWPSLDDPRVHERACRSVVDDAASRAAARARAVTPPIPPK